jgi:hypothetical protein
VKSSKKIVKSKKGNVGAYNPFIVNNPKNKGIIYSSRVVETLTNSYKGLLQCEGVRMRIWSCGWEYMQTLRGCMPIGELRNVGEDRAAPNLSGY